MPELRTNSETLTIKLSLAEKIFGLKGDIRIPRSEISGAEVVEDGLSTARGIRAPGLSLPGVIKIGTWRRVGEKSFVSARRDRPALRIDLAPGSDWTRIVVNCGEAPTLAHELSASLGSDDHPVDPNTA